MLKYSNTIFEKNYFNDFFVVVSMAVGPKMKYHFGSFTIFIIEDLKGSPLDAYETLHFPRSRFVK